MTSPTPPAPARILMYTAFLSPEYSGAALQALTLARELRQHGHQVSFITNRWPGLSADAVIDGFRVTRLQPGRLRKHREFRLWFNMVCHIWNHRHDFDILHSHGAYYTHSFIGPLGRLFGLRTLVKASLARDDLHGMSRPVIGALHRWMLGKVDACVGISRDLVAEFRDAGVKSERIHHVPNGVDTRRFCPLDRQAALALRSRLGLPASRPVVLYVGVLDARKNILWLAEQWIANSAFGSGALLLAVGPQGRDDTTGGLKRRLDELARMHPDLFALRDFADDVLPFYQSADALVLPSTNEGLPNVVLEAMACGLPCIAAQASGSRELVVDGETGQTYQPLDVSALAAAVKACLSPAGAAMGALARQRAVRDFSIQAIASRYRAIYAQLRPDTAAAPTHAPRGNADGTTASILARPRRILYVENGIGYGGAIICLRHLVRNLDRRRYEPMVITGLGDSKYQDIANEARWKHIPDKRVDVMTLKRRLAAASWPDTVPGLRWICGQVLARLDDLLNFLPALVQTLWIVIQFRPALIHVNNEPLCNRAAVLAGKLLRIPVVSHVRGDQSGSLLMHSFFRLPDQFIAVSRWVSESIGAIGVPERKRTYIYDGIELDKLNLLADGARFRQAHGLAADVFVVGLVGLLIPWKGQRLFLDAVALLAHQMPTAVFAIVGGTPEEFQYFEAELRQSVLAPPLTGRVVFTGHVSDMASVYNGLDVVLSASTSPEPLGTMIIEAMTMARPIIAPNHGGAVEMIDSGRTGLLFRPNDAADLAEQILRLHADRALGLRLGQAARAQALQTFAIHAHVNQVQAVYQRLLGVLPGRSEQPA